jgi:hypothetical protein
MPPTDLSMHASWGGAHAASCLYVGQFVAPPLIVHPTLWLDLQEQILNCGNTAQEMLLSYIADWKLGFLAVHNGDAKDLLCQKDALGMMAKRPVTEVRQKRFRSIEPVMNREVVLRLFRRTSVRCSPRASVGGPLLKPHMCWSCNPRTGHSAQP